MSNPFFSIIIPTYNRADLITKTVGSVLSQTHKNYEIIIVDDGSSDNTEQIVSSLQCNKIRYFKKDNEERAKARNYGVKQSTGEYIYFLDSDDLLYPNHLELALQFIKENHNPPIFFQPYEIIDQNGHKIRSLKLPKGDSVNQTLLKNGNILSCHGIFLQKKLALEFRFNEDRELSGSEDYELWLRICARKDIIFQHAVTSGLVQHNNRSVFNFTAKSLIKRKELMISYLEKDSTFMSKHKKFLSTIRVNSFMYLSLHLAIIKEKKLAIKYLIKSLAHRPYLLFSRKFLAICKHLILHSSAGVQIF